MKILFDHQAFTMQNFGGVSRIFFELSNHLRHYSGVEVKYPKMFSDNEYIYKDKTIGAWEFFRNTKFKGRGTLLTYLKKANLFYSRLAINKGEFDIFHPTYYDPYFTNFKIKKPTVVTCYDLIHEKYKQADIKTLAWKKKSLYAAAKIIAISNKTKSDLIEYYNIPEDKIGVVHLASSFKPVDNNFSEPNRDRPYFLFVGNRDSYKNFDFLVQSMTPLLLKRNEINLYCVGGPKFSKTEVELFNELKINSKLKHFAGSSENLKMLYSGAIALIYPSLYEGFGIPLLEAMSFRCPVLCSNVSSLPEVAASAAIYFDPTKEESILNSVSLILEDENLRKSLINKGSEQVKKFSWERSARETLGIYNSIL